MGPPKHIAQNTHYRRQKNPGIHIKLYEWFTYQIQCIWLNKSLKIANLKMLDPSLSYLQLYISLGIQ